MTSNIINRPILAVVISVLIVIFGLISLVRLPMTLFPSVAPPEVNVTVEYTGANAETVTKAAIVKLELAINGVPGMKYMSSDAGNDGVGVVQILFETGTDPDVAAINVQNRVNAVMGELPTEVIRNGVKIAKEENAMLMYLNIYSSDSSHNEKFLYNFADLNLLSELKRIKGVGYADIVGAKEYAMRIWLKPDRMLTYGISSGEILEILGEQNIEAAPGKIGEGSDKESLALQYTIKYTGKFNTKEQYENIPIKADESGKILRIKDIADVEFGTTYFDVEAKLNGKPSAAIALKQLPGSNASEVISKVKTRLAELKSTTFLEGMDYEMSFDVSRFLDAFIHEVIKTLIEAFILVAIVVFIFLQDWRSTLIPVLAVPVSLIGTFAIMPLLGFSLNIITLFAIVLSIGIVVDNAIVVIEAVHAQLERNKKLTVKQATRAAMSEISGAIVAITLVMSAVFIPVAFISGPSGIFYNQLSLTLAASIVLSGIVALTLTPALCALLLKRHHESGKSLLGRFFNSFNERYSSIESKYERLVSNIITRKVIIFGSIILFLFSTGILGKIIAQGFIPNEDQGTFYVSVTTPPGATLERTKSVVNEIQKRAEGLAPIESVSSLAGTNILSDGTGATYGTLLVNLKPWSLRKESVYDMIDSLSARAQDLKGAQIEFFPPPPIPGYGNASGFELRVLDKTGTGDIKRMEQVVKQFIVDLKKEQDIASAFSIFDASYPQFTVNIDLDNAAQKGITANDAMGTLQTLLGSEYATNFIRFGQMYKVMVQAYPSYRMQPTDLLKFTVKNNTGELVPFSSFATLEKSYGVDQMTRYNMFPSAELNGEGKPGVSSGSVINKIKQVAKNKLPRGYDIDWAGITRDEVNAGNESIYILLICLLFVYLILAAQYESLLLPLPIILSIPIGIFGSFLFLYVFGLENNIYSQIALVMLIGLLGKNAILIVEFASLQHKQGVSAFDAAVQGAKIRLRPILMTSFAFIAGLIPLMLATGAGAVGNKTIGTAAAGGMLIGTVFGVILVPGLYYIFAKISEKFNKSPDDEQIALSETI
jgi:HAE1 family hydrophobic/amphiphilic exporter-1